jgi:DNA helicase HerA-like ATPase
MSLVVDDQQCTFRDPAKDKQYPIILTIYDLTDFSAEKGYQKEPQMKKGRLRKRESWQERKECQRHYLKEQQTPEEEGE